MKPIFNNKENKAYTTEDGTIWYSRSCAVVAHVYAFVDADTYILLVKRGQHGDAKGLWCLPCGYIDWNENLQQARNREVFEETNVDLSQYNNGGKIFSNDEPFHVYSNPDENKQNIAMHMGFVFMSNELPITNNSNAAYGEIEETKWVNIDDIINKNDYQFAFNHDKKIEVSYSILTK